MDKVTALRLVTNTPSQEYMGMGYRAMLNRGQLIRQYELKGFMVRVFKRHNDYRLFILTSLDEDADIVGEVQFNRSDIEGPLVDIKHVYMSHASLMPELQGKGIASFLYQKFLDDGNLLVTGDRHSTAANKLWRSLATKNDAYLIDSDSLRFLKPNTPPIIAVRKEVRLLLAGKGWSYDMLERTFAAIREKRHLGLDEDIGRWYAD